MVWWWCIGTHTSLYRMQEYCCGILCAFSYLSSEKGKWNILDWAREGGSEAFVLFKKAICWTIVIAIVLTQLWLVSWWLRWIKNDGENYVSPIHRPLLLSYHHFSIFSSTSPPLPTAAPSSPAACHASAPDPSDR